MSKQGIVVGGGLAGVAAGNTLLENGASVVLLDKSAFCGGNSSKATSGINGANTSAQRANGITDSIELFTKDTIKGGAKKPAIAQVLCGNSGTDVEWLMEKFALDLSLVARLGGHSAPRTHRGKERFPGMTITYALIQMLEKVAEVRPDIARIVTKAKVVELLMDENGVRGCVYQKQGKSFDELGPVILCTGGFGADFTSNSLLATYRPDLIHLPTTNGQHCTGDGIKMGEAIGARTIDLEWVQVHPTGLVKPDEPDAKIKFLAAEALRGVGGLILNKNGERFCNELGRRDYVTGEMWKNNPPFRLVLNKKASDEIIWHCKHYTGRGVMREFKSGEEFAKDLGVSVETLIEVHDQHYLASQKQASEPDGGPYPAYPDGKSWDHASGKTGSAKKFYHNVLPGSGVRSEPFYVAIITPVIHYCMGGLEVNTDSSVIGEDGPIVGLYGAGEVAGGVHGNNRLGGNSLLDCVVFGRVSGKHCARYLLGNAVRNVDLVELSGGGLAEKAVVKAETPKKEEAAGAAASEGYSMDEVAKHNDKNSCWVVLHGRVLDVTTFLKDHPGGELAILTFAGKDATAEFDMIHPPGVVEKYAPNAVIGALKGAVAAQASSGAVATSGSVPGKSSRRAKDWSKKAANHEEAMKSVGKMGGCCGALAYMVFAFMREVIFTIFWQKSLTLASAKNSRIALTRSAMFMFIFIVIHAVGNLHVFLGPDDFNGYGYFYVRLYFIGIGESNIVEDYVLLAALLHIIIAVKRTAEINVGAQLSSGKLNLIISGLSLLTFMCVHLFQFRFGDTDKYYLCPPPYYLNIWGVLTLNGFNLFWIDVQNDSWTLNKCWTDVTKIPVRDIYKLEYEVFQSFGWVLFYICAVVVFSVHMCLGWRKVVGSPSLAIPQRHQTKAAHIGYVLTAFIALIYVSYPLWCYIIPMDRGHCSEKDSHLLVECNSPGQYNHFYQSNHLLR